MNWRCGIDSEHGRGFVFLLDHIEIDLRKHARVRGDSVHLSAVRRVDEVQCRDVRRQSERGSINVGGFISRMRRLHAVVTRRCMAAADWEVRICLWQCASCDSVAQRATWSLYHIPVLSTQQVPQSGNKAVSACAREESGSADVRGGVSR